MNHRHPFKNGFLAAVGFASGIAAIGIAAAAWNSAMSPATTGGTLAAANWNAVVDNVNDLNSRAWSAVTGGVGYSSGKVGIGTAAPVWDLHINSSSDTGNQIRISNKTENSSWLMAKRSDTYSTPGNFLLSNWNGSVWTQAMDVTPSGNVGIGTATPMAKLDVNGKLKVQVDPTVVTSTADTIPESYKFSRSDCNADTRGSMFVGRFSWDSNQDGLCVCLNIAGVMEWTCFNP